MDIAENVKKVEQQIRSACAEAGRDYSSVTVIAVSKGQPLQVIHDAVAERLSNFGENYVSEAVTKIDSYTGQPICWHFLGPLQSNKTAAVATHFAWVHSLDRLKVAQRLSAQRPANLPPLNVCVQVNIDNENTKSGVSEIKVPYLIEMISRLPHMTVRGLMAIPSPDNSDDERVRSFARMRQLFDRQRENWPHLDTLSMGMSKDFGLAIREGATMIRIGTNIFGARQSAAVANQLTPIEQ